MTAAGIDRAAIAALALLVVGYSLAIGDAITPSAGWAWLGVALILIGANLLRLRFDVPISRVGVSAGVAALLIALLRISGVVVEVTLPIALAAVVLSLGVALITSRLISR